MAKHESAWKQMLHFYRDEYHEKHAPMLYGEVWLQTKSHQRLVLGLTDPVKAELPAVTQLTLPTEAQHLNAGDVLATLTTASGERVITTPFGGTVQQGNADLVADPGALRTNRQKDNWLVQLKAD